jgi:hypothetical protein
VAEVSADDIEAITRWLTASGFALQVDEENRASFGNRLQEWERGNVRYRMVRDRGQWFVDTSRSGWEDWFDIDLVSYVCDSREDSALGRAKAAAIADLDHLLPALRSARRQLVEDHLGIALPPRHPDTDDHD